MPGSGGPPLEQEVPGRGRMAPGQSPRDWCWARWPLGPRGACRDWGQGEGLGGHSRAQPGAAPAAQGPGGWSARRSEGRWEGRGQEPSALPPQDPSREPTQRLLCCQRPRWALGSLRGLDLGPRAPGSSLSVRLSHRPRAPLGLCVHDTPRGASSRPLGRQRLGLRGPLPSTRGRSLPTQGPQPVRTASPDAG